MKFLLLTVFIAVAVASPVHRFVQPGPGGPAPIIIDGESIAIGPAFINPPISGGPAIISPEPIAIGPAIVNPEGIAVGPAIINPEPIAIGPAIVNPGGIAVGPALIDESVVAEAAAQPLVQIIINVNEQGQVIGTPVVNPVPVETPIVPEPVMVVETAPAEIGVPVLPAPVIPGILN